MLFCCEGCAWGFCEDHLPAEADVVKESRRFDALGMARPRTTCYVRCSALCGVMADAVAPPGPGAEPKSPFGAGPKSSRRARPGAPLAAGQSGGAAAATAAAAAAGSLRGARKK
jgi:hypothetical protein